MKTRLISQLAIFGLVALLMVSIFTAAAASNTVPSARMDNVSSGINANVLKPSQCAALNLTTIVICPSNGTCNGSAKSELIIGSTNADTIKGKGGADCILGGDGDDDITGGAGGDVCIGGPGNDTFHSCETTIQ
jgi:Ca2+-binding RTX toxin-like protein